MFPEKRRVTTELQRPFRRIRLDKGKNVNNQPFASLIHSLPQQCQIAERLLQNDSYNTDAWVVLLEYAKNVQPINDIARYIFNSFLRLFPTVPQYWAAYARSELAAKQYDHVDSIFSTCLETCPDVQLYLVYLDYIQIKYEEDPLQIDSAFKKAITRLGDDCDALQIWKNYITFLEKIPISSSADAVEKTNRIREVYHRVLILPIKGLDILYKAYDSFEYNYSAAAQAQAYIAEFSPKYQHALAVYAKRKIAHSKIIKHLIPRPLVVDTTQDASSSLGVAAAAANSLGTLNNNETGTIEQALLQEAGLTTQNVLSNLSLSSSINAPTANLNPNSLEFRLAGLTKPTPQQSTQPQHGIGSTPGSTSSSTPGSTPGSAPGPSHTPVLSLVSQPTHSTALLSQQQLSSWLLLIKHERLNPLRLPQDVLYQRVQGVFQQASMYLLHFPEFWHAYASFEHEANTLNVTRQGTSTATERSNSVKVYMRAIECMPYTPLPTLLLADFYEEGSQIVKARKMYYSLLITEKNANASAKDNAKDGAKETKEGSDTTTATTTTTTTSEGDESSTASISIGTIVLTPEEKLYGPFTHLTPIVMEETPLIAYIQLLRFQCRVNGVDDARKSFHAFTKMDHCPWELYALAAEIEHTVERASKAAVDIYESAMKRYPSSIPLVISYAQFLESKQDYANLTLHFERVLSATELRLSDPTGWASVASMYINHMTRICTSLSKIEQIQLRRNSLLGLTTMGVFDGTLIALSDNKSSAMSSGMSGISGLTLPNISMTSSHSGGHGGHSQINPLYTQNSTMMGLAAANVAVNSQKEPLSYMSRLYLLDIVDRMKFMNILPCSDAYIRILEAGRYNRLMEVCRSTKEAESFEKMERETNEKMTAMTTMNKSGETRGSNVIPGSGDSDHLRQQTSSTASSIDTVTSNMMKLYSKKKDEIRAFLQSPPILRTVTLKPKRLRLKNQFPALQRNALIPYSSTSPAAQEWFDEDLLNTTYALSTQTTQSSQSHSSTLKRYITPISSKLYPSPIRPLPPQQRDTIPACIQDFLWKIPSVRANSSPVLSEQVLKMLNVLRMPLKDDLLANYNQDNFQYLETYFPPSDGSIGDRERLAGIENRLGYNHVVQRQGTTLFNHFRAQMKAQLTTRKASALIATTTIAELQNIDTFEATLDDDNEGIGYSVAVSDAVDKKSSATNGEGDDDNRNMKDRDDGTNRSGTSDNLDGYYRNAAGGNVNEDDSLSHDKDKDREKGGKKSSHNATQVTPNVTDKMLASDEITAILAALGPGVAVTSGVSLNSSGGSGSSNSSLSGLGSGSGRSTTDHSKKMDISATTLHQKIFKQELSKFTSHLIINTEAQAHAQSIDIEGVDLPKNLIFDGEKMSVGVNIPGFEADIVVANQLPFIPSSQILGIDTQGNVIDSNETIEDQDGQDDQDGDIEPDRDDGDAEPYEY